MTCRLYRCILHLNIINTSLESGNSTMTANEYETLINAMRDVIVRTVHPLRIILFGSLAAGTVNEHSDVDFLVIEKQRFGAGRSRRKEAAKIWRALMPFEIAKDILVYSKLEYPVLCHNYSLSVWYSVLHTVFIIPLRAGS